jgi:hypothetical protein
MVLHANRTLCNLEVLWTEHSHASAVHVLYCRRWTCPCWSMMWASCYRLSSRYGVTTQQDTADSAGTPSSRPQQLRAAQSHAVCQRLAAITHAVRACRLPHLRCRSRARCTGSSCCVRCSVRSWGLAPHQAPCHTWTVPSHPSAHNHLAAQQAGLPSRTPMPAQQQFQRQWSAPGSRPQTWASRDCTSTSCSAWTMLGQQLHGRLLRSCRTASACGTGMCLQLLVCTSTG